MICGYYSEVMTLWQIGSTGIFVVTFLLLIFLLLLQCALTICFDFGEKGRPSTASDEQCDMLQVGRHDGSCSLIAEEDRFFELISRSQSRRLNDQRCSARHLTPQSGTL